MNRRIGRAWLVALMLAAVLGWGIALGSRTGWLMLAVSAVCVLVLWGLWWAWQHAGDGVAAMRERLGRADAGQHHAFGGVRLRVEDDGRHVWIGGRGLQRVLGRPEPEEAQAARHAGAWRRNERGLLMLRVDAVVQNLATMPGRHEPRIQKLRRYLEHDVLYPAHRRHQAARPARHGSASLPEDTAER